MALLVVNFFGHDRYEFLIAPFSVIYTGVLALYVGTKEFDRWYEMHDSRHPGELFVIAWTGLMLGLTIISFAIAGYRVSSESVAVYIMVLSVFAITQKSKVLHTKKTARKKT